MESKVNLRKGKVGFPKSAILKLDEKNTITITVIEDNSIILNSPLTTLTDIGQGWGFIAFKVSGEYYSLDFYKIWQKMFGLVGFLFARKASAEAKKWEKIFIDNGLEVKKQFM